MIKSHRIKYLFYIKESEVIDPSKDNKVNLDSIYTFRIWRASLFKIIPKGIPYKKAFIRLWILNLPKILFNLNFDFALICDSKQVVHYTGIYLKRSFQYPFMKKEDLQLGPMWTHEQYRRKGLASYTLHEILRIYESRNRTFWATIEENNAASIGCIEKGGFFKYATGIKKTFGIYSIKKVIKSINATENYARTSGDESGIDVL